MISVENISSLNGIKAQTFIVHEPVAMEVQDITEKHLNRLDRAGAVTLARQLKKALVEAMNEMEAKQASIAPVVHGVVDNTLESDVLKPVVDYSITEPSKQPEGSKTIHRPKSYMTHNNWTPELRSELKRQADKGISVTEIHIEFQKNGLPYTKNSLKAQLRLLGYSIKKDIPVKKSAS